MDSVLQSELLACSESEARPSFGLPKLFVWVGATVGSWGLVFALARLIWH